MVQMLNILSTAINQEITAYHFILVSKSSQMGPSFQLEFCLVFSQNTLVIVNDNTAIFR